MAETEANIVSDDGSTEFDEIMALTFTMYQESSGEYQDKETKLSVVQVGAIIPLSVLRGLLARS